MSDNEYCVYYREAGQTRGELLVENYSYISAVRKAQDLAGQAHIESVGVLMEIEWIKSPQ